MALVLCANESLLLKIRRIVRKRTKKCRPRHKRVSFSNNVCCHLRQWISCRWIERTNSQEMKLKIACKRECRELCFYSSMHVLQVLVVEFFGVLRASLSLLSIQHSLFFSKRVNICIRIPYVSIKYNEHTQLPIRFSILFFFFLFFFFFTAHSQRVIRFAIQIAGCAMFILVI